MTNRKKPKKMSCRIGRLTASSEKRVVYSIYVVYPIYANAALSRVIFLAIFEPGFKHP